VKGGRVMNRNQMFMNEYEKGKLMGLIAAREEVEQMKKRVMKQNHVGVEAGQVLDCVFDDLISDLDELADKI
jgi:hypothetical protein